MALQRVALSFAVILGSVMIAAAIAWAGSRGSAEIGGVPVLFSCAAIAFGVQWLAFVPVAFYSGASAVLALIRASTRSSPAPRAFSSLGPFKGCGCS